jgi:hypothetical protein
MALVRARAQRSRRENTIRRRLLAGTRARGQGERGAFRPSGRRALTAEETADDRRRAVPPCEDDTADDAEHSRPAADRRFHGGACDGCARDHIGVRISRTGTAAARRVCADGDDDLGDIARLCNGGATPRDARARQVAATPLAPRIRTPQGVQAEPRAGHTGSERRDGVVRGRLGSASGRRGGVRVRRRLGTDLRKRRGADRLARRHDGAVLGVGAAKRRRSVSRSDGGGGRRRRKLFADARAGVPRKPAGGERRGRRYDLCSFRRLKASAGALRMRSAHSWRAPRRWRRRGAGASGTARRRRG